MRVHAISILCALTCALSAAKEYFPRVTKSIVEGPHNCDFSLPVRLGDSDTLMHKFEDHLNISFDNGESWQTVDMIENVRKVIVDRFHQERAFVLTRSQKIWEMYVTEDQGKNWKKLSLPKHSGELERKCFPITHPFSKKLLLLHCDIGVGFEVQTLYGFIFKGSVIYGSDDGGESFNSIAASPHPDDSPSPDSITTCKFAASSKESTFDWDGIYCIQIAEKPEDTQVQFSNETSIGSREELFQQERKSVIGTLFYTTDLGKTKKVFDELNGLSVEQIFVLPSHIGILTSDGSAVLSRSYNEPNDLWVSDGDFFKSSRLPEGTVRIRSLERFPGNDQGRLLLTSSMENEEYWGKSGHLLLSDSSGLNFSFYNPISELATSAKLEQLGNLKGTLWGTFNFDNIVEEKVNWLRRVIDYLKDLFSRKPHFKLTGTRWLRKVHVIKGSFDGGKTWTNLKVLDPSGKHRRLFNCNVDDVEHCSFQERMSSGDTGNEPAIGIMMKSGTVGRDYDFETSSYKDDMTFISRDGGMSWEIVFGYPMMATLLDFGNIIVAVQDADVCREFFFSLDQGRSWKKYHFKEPIHADSVTLSGWGLKIHMGFNKFDDGYMKYVSYSIDFSDAFDGTACTVNDRETWYLSNGSCIDGMRYSYDRRKPDAKCLMRKTFGTLELHQESCES